MDIFEPADITIYIQGRGVVLKEKSLVAYNPVSKKILAVGKEAEHMAKLSSENIEIISPMRRGVIVDYIAAAELFAYLLRKAWGKNHLFFRRLVAVCVPHEITLVEKKVMEDVLYQAGAKEVLVSDILLEQLLEKLPEYSGNWQKVETFIAITKEEPKRYIEEQLSTLLRYAAQQGISVEEVMKLLQNENSSRLNSKMESQNFS